MRLIAVIGLLLFSAPVFCVDIQEWDLSSPHKLKCGSGNQLENNSYIHSEYAEVDSELNKLYDWLVRSLVKPKSLVRAQRAWILFRDAHCKFSAEGNDGSGHSYTEDACLIDLTEKRILDLKMIVPCNGCVEFK